MKIELLMSKLFGFSPQTYFNWKRDEDKRPIIGLLGKYFCKKDLEEFLQTGKIQKFDNLLTIQSKVIKFQAKKYINTFLQKTQSNTLKYVSPYFINFYFSFLIQFENLLKTEKFESLSVNKKSFHALINNFFIDFVFKYKKEEDKQLKNIFKTISSYFYLFSDWDELMVIFLSQAMKNKFADLYTTKDVEFNKVVREEVAFHVIGLYVYQKYSDFSLELKVNLIKKLAEKTQDKDFDYKELINFIEATKSKTINMLIELDFDKHY